MQKDEEIHNLKEKMGTLQQSQTFIQQVMAITGTANVEDMLYKIKELSEKNMSTVL